VSNERQQRAARAEQMRKEREKAEKRQRNVITIGIVVIVLALIAVGGYAIKSTSDERAKQTDVVTPKGATDDHGITYTAEDAGGKAATDAVEVVIYEDFQCPVCKAFEQANGAFLDEAVKNGDITIEYRLLTFLDRASPNQYSSRAGSAALCAFESGGGEAYKKVANLLWANQPAENTEGPEDPALVDTLKQAGVSGDAAESCVVKNQFVPWLEEATEASRDAKVSGTPTVRIDGKDVTGANKGVPQIPDLEKAITDAKNA
jgi:protein-disulfide isomerase